jgi:hypothetical protein
MQQPEQTVVQLRLTGQSREDVERVLNDIKRHYGPRLVVTRPPKPGRSGDWLAYTVVLEQAEEHMRYEL